MKVEIKVGSNDYVEVENGSDEVLQVRVTPRGQTAKTFEIVDPGSDGTQKLQLRSGELYLYLAPTTTNNVQFSSKTTN